jgi:Leucine-rich repeat (LRR) protein
LEKLWLSGNQIPSIESISKLTNLVDLWLDDAGIVTGTAALVSLTKAENIDLSGNAKIPCTDLDRLEAALEADVVIRPDTCQ